MKLAIYGAQSYATGAYEAIKTLYPERNVLCFVVTKSDNNPTELMGLPVKEIAELSSEITEEEKKDFEVIIATPENVQAEIEATLDGFGFYDHIRLDIERWDELMRSYHLKMGRFRPLFSFPKGADMPAIHIYMAKSHKDRELTNKYKVPEYMVPIQVGAADSEINISELRDDEGVNISYKNGNYSELTGLYWIWKNILCEAKTSAENSNIYYGLAQYRRILHLDDEELLKIADNDVDVVLPYPLPYEPDINSHHERYIREADWTALLAALGELQPDYADYFPTVLGQRYLYNYNVILAKKAILKDYCEWLFPVLERIEDLSQPKGSERSDRYIGYMGETLETLYFMKNADKYKIAHTSCKMLI